MPAELDRLVSGTPAAGWAYNWPMERSPLSVQSNDGFLDQAWFSPLGGYPVAGLGLTNSDLRAAVQTKGGVEAVDLHVSSGREHRRFALIDRLTEVLIGPGGEMVATRFEGRDAESASQYSLRFFTSDGREVANERLPGGIRSHAFSESLFLSAHVDGALRAWSLSGELKWEFVPPREHHTGAKVVVAGAGGILCASHRSAHLLHESGRELWSFEPPFRKRPESSIGDSMDAYVPFMDFDRRAEELLRIAEELAAQHSDDEMDGRADPDWQPPGDPRLAEGMHQLDELQQSLADAESGVSDVLLGPNAAWVVAFGGDLWRLDLHGRVVAQRSLGVGSNSWTLVGDYRGEPRAGLGESELALLDRGKVTSAAATTEWFCWGGAAFDDAVVIWNSRELFAIDRAGQERFRATTKKRIGRLSVATRDLIVLAVGGTLVALRRRSAGDP